MAGFLRLQHYVGKRFPKRFVANVRLNGVIMDQQPAKSNQISLDRFDATFQAAFASNPHCVALSINSPGGSATQSSLMYKRIKSYKAYYENLYATQIPVIAFVEDMAASGGYYLACAADEIIADKCSLVGSIGVIAASFGFQEGMQKLGIERRVHTAGERKSFIDPFKPETPEQVEKVNKILHSLHRAFIEDVAAGRAGKLKGTHDQIFNGEIFSVEEGLELGLVDGVGDMYTYCNERFKASPPDLPIQIRTFKPKPAFGFF